VPLFIGARPDVEELTELVSDAQGLAELGLTNRSTACDWARFFWDLATERDVPAETLSDLLVNMTPSTLDPDDNGTSTTTDEDPCGSDTTADDVTVRLLDAAANTWCFDCPIPGFLSDEVALEVEHGQDH
jgi:hypothetical protein